MTISEKLNTIAENQQKIYEAGQKSLGVIREVVGNPAQLVYVHPTEHELDVQLTSDTITDFSSVKVHRYGKNLLHLDGREIVDWGASSNTTKRIFTGNGIMLGVTRANNYIPSRCSDVVVGDNAITGKSTNEGYGIGLDVRVLPNTKYIASFAEHDGWFCIGQYNTNGEYLTYAVVSNVDNSFTTHADAAWCLIVFAYGTDGQIRFINPQIELGSVATAYEQGATFVECVANSDGTVTGIKSVSPITILGADAAEVQIVAKYYADSQYEVGRASVFADLDALNYFFVNGQNMKLFDELYNMDMSNITRMQYTFLDNTILTEFVAPDTMRVGAPHGMFQRCTSLVTVSGLERAISSSVLTDLFNGCTSLVDAGTLNFDSVGYCNRTFQDCTSLKEVRIVGSIRLTIDLQYSPLSKESIESVVAALSDSATGQTVTFNKAAVNTAFTDDEWNALIATKTNWSYGLS